MWVLAIKFRSPSREASVISPCPQLYLFIYFNFSLTPCSVYNSIRPPTRPISFLIDIIAQLNLRGRSSNSTEPDHENFI